jgi:hypothetical protein
MPVVDSFYEEDDSYSVSSHFRTSNASAVEADDSNAIGAP